jgi:serine/threonine-protein kinase
MASANQRWERLNDVFHGALDVAEGERDAFLSRECQDDAGLMAEVRALIAAHLQTHRLLDAPAPDQLPSGMRIGPYAIDWLIGTGGMAAVYLAHRADRRFEKHVAIKLLGHGHVGTIHHPQFEAEQRLLARLEHPNIARLLDAGVTEFLQPYLVMEWVDGVTLDAWVSASTPALDARLDLWLELASAVSYAHQRLVVHRDLKPSNVIVGRDGRARLVDFGIGTLVSAEGLGARTETLRFTPRYASPEQAEGRAVTTAADVYGLGVLLFELVTDAHPLPTALTAAGPTREALEDLHVPSSVAPDLAAILRQSLRYDPERRYATVEQFADDVRRFRAGQPVRAQDDTLAYRVRRFVARHRVAVAATAAAAVVLLTMTALALRQARLATEQRARAEEITGYITGFLGATPTGLDWAMRDRGAGMRVVDLADLIGERLAGARNVHPETEAALRYVLGMVYVQTGQLETANGHVRQSVELYKRLVPADDPRRLSADLLQAAADNMLGRFAEAEAAILRLRAMWKDPPTSALAGMHEQLGLAQFRLGRVDAAERTYEEGMALLEARFGVRDHHLALLGSNLAMVHLERGDFARAAQELEQATAIVKDQARGSSLSLAWGLVNLANAYRFLGRHDDMLRTAREGADRMREALGDQHFSMVHPLSFIAYGLAITGQPGAVEMAQQAVAVQASLPPDHYERAVGLTFLGFALMQHGDLSAAERALTDALALRRARFEAPNWRIAETAGFLGEALARSGALERARPLLDESVKTFTALYGPGNPRTLDAQARQDRALASTRTTRNIGNHAAMR